MGVGGDAAASGGVAVVVQRGHRDFDARTAQQVHRRERLNLLEFIGEQDKHGGHEGDA